MTRTKREIRWDLCSGNVCSSRRQGGGWVKQMTHFTMGDGCSVSLWRDLCGIDPWHHHLLFWRSSKSPITKAASVGHLLHLSVTPLKQLERLCQHIPSTGPLIPRDPSQWVCHGEDHPPRSVWNAEQQTPSGSVMLNLLKKKFSWMTEEAMGVVVVWPKAEVLMLLLCYSPIQPNPSGFYC